MIVSNLIVQLRTVLFLGVCVIIFIRCGDSDDQELILKNVPDNAVDHNREYRYKIISASNTMDEVAVNAISIPNWLTLDKSKNLLFGIAGWNNVNQNFQVKLSVQQGEQSTELSFNISVGLGEIICEQDFGDPSESLYVLPFLVGETFTFSQSYCSENPNWGHHEWFAYDIDMETGTTVVASRAGEVIAVREDREDVGGDCSGGKENFVFILHEDGTVMSYVHMTTNGVLVEVGDQVTQGQEIALSGNSGCSAGPHTHVALFKDRTNFDRQSTLPFNYSNADGPLDENQGLILKTDYSALNY